jgi:hypothetical protein
VAGRRSRSFHWDGKSTCICHIDGWAADQQGGRSDGAFPGDGEPETVNGGRSRTYHMDGWADIFCSRRRCSAEASPAMRFSKGMMEMKRNKTAEEPKQ